MNSFLVDDICEHKKEKGANKMLLKQYVRMNLKMFCWTINVKDIRWIESKVKITK